jgi:hypothetical protein
MKNQNKPTIDTSKYHERTGRKTLRGHGLWFFTLMPGIRCLGDTTGQELDWNSNTMFYSDHMSTYAEAKRKVLKRWPDAETIYLQQ